MYLIGMVQVYISCIAYTTVSDTFFEAKGAEACPPRLIAHSSTSAAVCRILQGPRGWGSAFGKTRPNPVLYEASPILRILGLELLCIVVVGAAQAVV